MNLTTRRGFSLIEMIVIVALLGILAAVTLPRFGRTSSAMSVRGAKQRVASYLAVARSAAIQRGRVARFVHSGNTIKVLIDSANTQGTFANVIDLGADQGVSVTTTRDTIAFDPRGLAYGFSGTARIVVRHGTKADSVCVIGMGRISTTGCS